MRLESKTEAKVRTFTPSPHGLHQIRVRDGKKSELIFEVHPMILLTRAGRCADSAD